MAANVPNGSYPLDTREKAACAASRATLPRFPHAARSRALTASARSRFRPFRSIGLAFVQRLSRPGAKIGVGFGEFRSEQKNLRRVIDPEQDHDQRTGRAIGGSPRAAADI